MKGLIPGGSNHMDTRDTALAGKLETDAADCFIFPAAQTESKPGLLLSSVFLKLTEKTLQKNC